MSRGDRVSKEMEKNNRRKEKLLSFYKQEKVLKMAAWSVDWAVSTVSSFRKAGEFRWVCFSRFALFFFVK